MFDQHTPSLSLPPELEAERERKMQEFMQIKNLRDGIALQLYVANAGRHDTFKTKAAASKTAKDCVKYAQIFMTESEMVPPNFFGDEDA
jgi:hypothetical protein